MNYFPVDRKLLSCIYEGEPKSVKGFNIFHVTEDRYAFGSRTTCVFLNTKVHVFEVSGNYHQRHKIYEEKECRMMNYSPYALSCAFVFHNELYIAGRGPSDRARIWKYNESNDTWTEVVTLPYYSAGTGVAIIRDEVHFFGGRESSSGGYYVLHFKFDGTTVTKLNDLPYDSVDCKVVTDSNGTIHIFGVNYQNSSSGTYREHYIYTSDGTFTRTDSPVLYPVQALAFVWANGAIHAIGNSNDSDLWKNNHYIWTLDNQQWTKAEDIPFIGAHYAAATSHDDIIEVVTGAVHCKKILGQWYNQSPAPYVIPIFN